MLEDFLPDLGLRARRRLVKTGQIQLNGRPTQPSCKPKVGEIIEFEPCQTENTVASQPYMLEVQDPYCFFYKPAGLHTAHIVGSPAPSLETKIPDLLPVTLDVRPVNLLQRLDEGTSGIVAAALGKDAEDAYRQVEKAGKISKFYLALLEGQLEQAVKIDFALDTANRQKTRVLPTQRGKSTFMQPLRIFASHKEAKKFFPTASPHSPHATLALCRIASGQRHQIRAHAAALGHPLCGDGIYGSGNGPYILEHFCLAFPGHEILLNNSDSYYYQLPPEIQEKIKELLSLNTIDGS